MRTQLTCPACQTGYPAEVHQIVDANQNPELKEALLGGYLNVARCPACGSVTQISGPILFHDPGHELFMVHVPMEMGLSHQEQEQMIGQLIQRAMDSIPPEQRRGYMLQPQTVLSMQTFIEKVFETEGITPKMLARQREQSELLQMMINSDKSTTDSLILEQGDIIDETFFALLRSMKEAADNSGDESAALKLTNLQARLYRDTETGKRLEKQQRAIHDLSRDANKAGSLSPELLLKHVLANRDDESVVNGLILAGQPAFNYQFFLLLSERIEKRQKAGIDASELLALRERLLKLQQEIEDRSKEVLDRAQSTLQSILEAEDKVSAVRANMSRIDETVMYVLSANKTHAEQQGNVELVNTLQEIETIISNQMEQQAPPEIRLINSLILAQSLEEQQILLDENSDLVKPELAEVLNLLAEDAQSRGQEELKDRIELIRSLIEARIAT